jgi:hypothetical protein
MSFNRFLCLSVGLCLLAFPDVVQACATCYGASDSPMAQGMNWGIMTLLAVVGCVLGGISSFFIYLGWRSSRMTSISIPSPRAEN